MDKYIRSEILKRHKLHTYQYAYKVGCSTETALAIAVDLIDVQLRNQDLAVGVLMNIVGAFSQASPKSIKRNMIWMSLGRSSFTFALVSDSG